MNVKLHIERLVIEGASLPPGGGRKLQAAVEAELTRLLAGEGVGQALQASGARASLSAGSIPAGASGNPTRFGIEIARAAHGALKHPDQP